MNGRQIICVRDIVDISAIADWCRLLGRGGWHELRTAIADLDGDLDPFDVARALTIDCAIDVDFDGDRRWSSPIPSLVVGADRTRVIGASKAYKDWFARYYTGVDVVDDLLTVGTRRATYKYSSLRYVGAPKGGAEGVSVEQHIAPWSFLRSLPSIAAIVAGAEEVEMPRVGRAAEKFVVSCDNSTFDAVPRTAYVPGEFSLEAGDPVLWRLPSSKTILVSGRKAYRVHDDVGRLHVILANVRRVGRSLRIDWYSTLDEGELAAVVALPRVRMPLMYRRALRIMGATYPPFSDAGRLWAVGVDPNLASELAGKLGMSFRKVD